MLNIKKILKKVIVKISGRKYLINVNKHNHGKNCLLMYITEPFLDKENLNTHQNQVQVIEMSKIIGEFGYNVDVIDYNNEKVKLDKKYDLILELHPGLNEVYKMNINEGCKKIAYITGSNPSFAYEREKKRIEDLEMRRKVSVRPRRTHNIKFFEKEKFEEYDAIFFIGNTYNWNTYKNFKIKKVEFIVNNGYCFENIKRKNNANKNWLFLASDGQVHKGLDLLLEIFSEKKFPYNLYICSNFKKEKDFCEVYKKELYESPNIFPVGFCDIKNEEFKLIIEKCQFIIMPSCSEGIAGSVLTGMSAGLIPIVSRECGFDDSDVINLEDCSIECIRYKILEYGNKNTEFLKSESERIKKIVENKYSIQEFKKSFSNALESVVRKT